MSIPDELVVAATEARCIRPEKVGMTGLVVTCDGHSTKHPECALQAAFAKLPECETANAPVWYSSEEAAAWAAGWDALAREFGGRE